MKKKCIFYLLIQIHYILIWSSEKIRETGEEERSEENRTRQKNMGIIGE